MKTGMNWFNKMNRKEKRRFKKEFIRYQSVNYFNYWLLVNKFDCFEGFLMGSFVFDRTRQGQDYWSLLLLKYAKK